MSGDKLTVTEADHEAAAKAKGYASLDDARYWGNLAGMNDIAALAKAFAAHRTNTTTELVDALNEAFDFLGGCDGASEIRGKILAALSLHNPMSTLQDLGQEYDGRGG